MTDRMKRVQWISGADKSKKVTPAPKPQNPSPKKPTDNQKQPGQNATSNNSNNNSSTTTTGPVVAGAGLAPMSNPQAVAAKAAANPPGAVSPKPTLEQVPAPAEEIPESRLAQVVRLLGEAAAGAMDGLLRDFVLPMYIDPNLGHPYDRCPTPDCSI